MQDPGPTVISPLDSTTRDDKMWSSDEEDPLEKSWMSLDHFNRSHCGRISGQDLALALEQSTSCLPVNEEENEESDFFIPELPLGSLLGFEILSTWGDPFYVGLNGVELFDSEGQVCRPQSVFVEGGESQEEVPAFAKPENLVDGQYRTRDDTRLWWTRFNPGHPLTVSFQLPAPTQVAMIRIWNYNKSRIHSCRGAREIEILLDGECIFRGEISKAMGPRERDTELLGDTILFTMREDILEKIRGNDRFLREEEGSMEEEAGVDEKSHRPGTGEKQVSSSDSTVEHSSNGSKGSKSIFQMLSIEGATVIFKGSKLTLEIVETWGDTEFVGLCKLKIVGRDGEPMTVSSDMIRSSRAPVPNKLVEGAALTTKAEDMWLCGWGGEGVSVDVAFPSTQDLSGIILWNYNASLETSYSGVKRMNIYLDGEIILRDIWVRKAPGNLHYDFAQEIYFGDSQNVDTPGDGDGLIGFVFQIQLLSTWGDEFYVGLNGIVLLDQRGNPIPISFKNLVAVPESVNTLPGVSEDPRSSDKLIDGEYATTDPNHMWLAPLIPNLINRVYVIFDSPTRVSEIRIWNYAKTPARGGRDLLVLVDDLIVHDTELPIYEAGDPESGKICLKLTE